MSDRQNALLTNSLRKYLRGEKEMETGYREYNSRIRGRTEASIADQLLLKSHLSDEELDKMASRVDATDAFQAAAFLEKLGERAMNNQPTTFEKQQEMLDRIDTLEKQIETLTRAFQSTLNMVEENVEKNND